MAISLLQPFILRSHSPSLLSVRRVAVGDWIGIQALQLSDVLLWQAREERGEEVMELLAEPQPFRDEHRAFVGGVAGQDGHFVPLARLPGVDGPRGYHAPFAVDHRLEGPAE